MKIIATEIAEVLLLEPKVFEDERGFFTESYNERSFREATGIDCHFVQDNRSRSKKNVLRGLHYQLPPMAQSKLVCVLYGKIYDVVVDVRRGSPTLGRWVGTQLCAEQSRQLWVPAGFAHGFLVQSEAAEVYYKTTAYYSAEHERCIAWDDAQLGIDWPAGAPLLSAKDRNASGWAQAQLMELER